jgi:hypothetical protein
VTNVQVETGYRDLAASYNSYHSDYLLVESTDSDGIPTTRHAGRGRSTGEKPSQCLEKP